MPERVGHGQECRGRGQPRHDVVGSAGRQTELAHHGRADHHDEDREHGETGENAGCVVESIEEAAHGC